MSSKFSTKCLRDIDVKGAKYKYFDLTALNDDRFDKLPISIRVLLESAVRHCDGFHVQQTDVENIMNWEKAQHENTEIPYKPARVILQDFTGVPVVVDFAAMRDAVKELGGDPEKINPICPADLVIDHSVQVDYFGSNDALSKNQQMEFDRNNERFLFLKWGAKAFKNLLIVPPGSGICHQVNLEYLARIAFLQNDLLYPDGVVGTDSHTTMIGGTGVLGWGVGGIEAEAVMLGQPISMVLPEVIGYKLTGKLPSIATSTDLVLAITKNLRDLGVVGKFVEFFGPGVATLSIADRATIANMCPEYGATVGYFPVDNRTLDYLLQTGRDKAHVERIETYLKANKMFVNYSNPDIHPQFTKVIELDLGTIVSSISGPKRPHDRVPVSIASQDFLSGLSAKASFKGFGVSEEKLASSATIQLNGKSVTIKHGSVVIAAITSCTNTSNPSVMLGAALVAKKAVEKGLTVPPYIKTSLSPGSGVVTKYLQKSKLLPFLEQLGFHLAGYGCMTCIGNSGPLIDEVSQAVENNDLVVASVLSGNRNFEGRVHPLTRANYLASPPLVVVYALAGRIDIDFEKEPIGTGKDGNDVYFRDIWPDRDDILEVEEKTVLPEFFNEVYSNIQTGSEQWQQLNCPDAKLYPWDPNSTYIKRPPFFDNMGQQPAAVSSIKDAYVLANVGDFITTDHISPAGAISRTSAAARYLGNRGLTPKDFNTYGSRRGNDEVMARGTFANIRLVNKFIGKPGPKTIHHPTGDELDIYDAADRYIQHGQQVIILAGKEYGSGSSRDWAAKGPYLQGVKAVIAESFERIHRSNLIGMGIMPVQYLEGQTADTLALSGKEKYTIDIPDNLKPRQKLSVKLDNGKSFDVICRFDTEVELTYFRHGGILQYMVRKLI